MHAITPAQIAALKEHCADKSNATDAIKAGYVREFGGKVELIVYVNKAAALANADRLRKALVGSMGWDVTVSLIDLVKREIDSWLYARPKTGGNLYKAEEIEDGLIRVSIVWYSSCDSVPSCVADRLAKDSRDTWVFGGKLYRREQYSDASADSLDAFAALIRSYAPWAAMSPDRIEIHDGVGAGVGAGRRNSGVWLTYAMDIDDVAGYDILPA